MKKCIFYTNKWNCYGVWINQCPIYYLNFHPVAIKMLGASWTGEITRMPLTTEEMECKRPNPPLTFHTANWDCLCQISSRTRSRQKVPWESDSGTLLPDTSMLEGSLWLDRGVWGPSSCTASVCVCEKDLQMFEWELCCLELKAEAGKQALPNFSNCAGKGIRHKPAFLSNERVWF